MEKRITEIVISPSTFVSTSWHRDTIRTTKDNIVKVFGEPTDFIDDVEEKSQNNWDVIIVFEDEEEIFATIYDWKQGYFGDSENIQWNIGAQNGFDAMTAREVFEQVLGIRNHDYTIDSIVK